MGQQPSCTVTFSGLSAGAKFFITIDLQRTDFDDSSEYINSVTVGSQSMSFSNNYRNADCGTSRIMDSVSVPSSAISGGQLTVTIQTSYEVNVCCTIQGIGCLTLYAVVDLCTSGCLAGESEIPGTHMCVSVVGVRLCMHTPSGESM